MDVLQQDTAYLSLNRVVLSCILSKQSDRKTFWAVLCIKAVFLFMHLSSVANLTPYSKDTSTHQRVARQRSQCKRLLHDDDNDDDDTYVTKAVLTYSRARPKKERNEGSLLLVPTICECQPRKTALQVCSFLRATSSGMTCLLSLPLWQVNMQCIKYLTSGSLVSQIYWRQTEMHDFLCSERQNVHWEQLCRGNLWWLHFQWSF